MQVSDTWLNIGVWFHLREQVDNTDRHQKDDDSGLVLLAN